MTKKHFVALARALRENDASNDLIRAVAAVCRDANPAFDMGRFVAAAKP